MTFLNTLLQCTPFILTILIFFVSTHRSVKTLPDSLQSQAVKFLFNSTMCCSLIILELVLCETGNWLNPESRLVAWKLSTFWLSIMLVAVLPAVDLYLFCHPNNRAKGLFVTACFVVWLYLFYRLGDYIPLVAQASTVSMSSLGEESLARIAVIGITIMGILSGFGAVSAPYSTFINPPRPVTAQDIDRLQRAVSTTDDLLRAKSSSLRSLQYRIREKVSMSTTNLMMKMMTSIRGGDEMANERSSLELELDALNKMRSALERDLQDMKTRYKRQIQGQTAFGQIAAKAYYVFALYCLYRLFMVFVFRNPLWRRSWSSTSTSSSSSSLTNDALAVSLAHLASSISDQFDVDGWTSQISFGLSGLVFMASLSSVWATFNYLTKAFPWLKATGGSGSSSGSGSGLALLIISQLVGIYIISTSLLLRSNLPKDMSTAITKALGAPLDTDFVDAWFDTMFAVVAITAVVGLWVASRYRDDDVLYDEEDLIEGKLA